MFSDHGSLTAGFQGNLRNVIVRKRHSGFEEFIFFAILVTILNVMKNEKKERTDPNERRKRCKLNENELEMT